MKAYPNDHDTFLNLPPAEREKLNADTIRQRENVNRWSKIQAIIALVLTFAALGLTAYILELIN